MRRFNLSDIMKAAWSHWRWVRREYATWQIERGIVDGSFANALRLAWEQAKEAAADAARTIVLASGPNAARAADIHRELNGLSFKSLRYDVPAMRRALEAELSRLGA